jgi:phosphoglycolate phosphatase
MPSTTVIFDWDGTLMDSDEALVRPFLALGVPREEITFGHTLDEECARLGISVADYIDVYDSSASQPWDGVEPLLAALEEGGVRWAVCSNKLPGAGWAELERLGWKPEAAHWSDTFGGRSKELGPMLAHLRVDAAEVLYVGDTVHDERCALQVGASFVLAGWNPRAAAEGDVPVLGRPEDVLDRLR